MTKYFNSFEKNSILANDTICGHSDPGNDQNFKRFSRIFKTGQYYLEKHIFTFSEQFFLFFPNKGLTVFVNLLYVNFLVKTNDLNI